VSQDPTLTGASQDSVVSQYALKTFLTTFESVFASPWVLDVYGINYDNGNVGIGALSDQYYRLRLGSHLDKYRILIEGVDTILNKYDLSDNRWSWYNEITTNYKIGDGSHYPFVISNPISDNVLVIGGGGIGINTNLIPHALTVVGNAEITGSLVYLSGLPTLTNTDILTYNTIGQLGKQSIYTIISDSLFWKKSGTLISTKSGITGVGIGVSSPDQLLHLKGLNNIYSKTESTGATSVSGFLFKNDIQTWSVRVRGDIADQFEIFDNTYSKIPISIQKNSPTYALRIYADSSVRVYDMVVSDSLTMTNMKEQATAFKVVTADVDGNFGYRTDIANGGGLMETDPYFHANARDTAVAISQEQWSYMYADTARYALSVLGDTTLWKLVPDTTLGDYNSDYSNDYLLASIDGLAIINKDSYNVKNTDNLTVKKNLIVNGAIMNDGAPTSRWLGVLGAHPVYNIQEGDLYFNHATDKVYIRANFDWKPLN